MTNNSGHTYLAGLFMVFLLGYWITASPLLALPQILEQEKDIEKSLVCFQVRIIKKQAVLRLKPDSDSVVLRKLPLGAMLKVVEKTEEWLKIKMPPDKGGFIVMGYLQKDFTEDGSLIHR